MIAIQLKIQIQNS